MKLYFDAAYVAKFYLKEPDSHAVRNVAEKAEALYPSEWCLAGVSCALHRQVREEVRSQRARWLKYGRFSVIRWQPEFGF